MMNIKSIKPATNLSRIQENAMKKLRDNEEFIIVNTDKNLGPAVMLRRNYIESILNEHLLDKQTYRRVTAEEALSALETIRLKLNSILDKFKDRLTSQESHYLRHHFQKANTRIPQFYGLPKIHKKGPSLPMRPVISQVGSLLASASTFCDSCLQKMRHLVHSYIQRSDEVKVELEKLGVLPKGAILFVKDATSMYTNIDPKHAIEILNKWFTEFESEIPKSICKDLIIELMEIILNNNFFQFGNTWWLQLIGIAMGTPVACILATLNFGYF